MIKEMQPTADVRLDRAYRQAKYRIVVDAINKAYRDGVLAAVDALRHPDPALIERLAKLLADEDGLDWFEDDQFKEPQTRESFRERAAACLSTVALLFRKAPGSGLNCRRTRSKSITFFPPVAAFQ